jgi:anti-sigma factor RsiW
LTCKEALDFLMDYLDGELPIEQRRAFEEHLRECPSCVRYIESYRATVVLAGGAYDRPAAPPSIPPGVMDAVRAALRRRR